MLVFPLIKQKSKFYIYGTCLLLMFVVKFKPRKIYINHIIKIKHKTFTVEQSFNLNTWKKCYCLHNFGIDLAEKIWSEEMADTISEKPGVCALVYFYLCPDISHEIMCSIRYRSPCYVEIEIQSVKVISKVHK